MVDFRNISQERQLSRLLVCVPAHQVPSEKRSTLKRKNLLLQGANSFLLEQTPFQNAGKCNFNTVASLERIPFPPPPHPLSDTAILNVTIILNLLLG